MGVGAPSDGDALALELGDLGNSGILAGDEGRPFRPRVDIDRLDRVAVDPGDQGGGASGGAEVDRGGVEELQGLVRAERLHPSDGNAILLELLLENFLLFQHQADGIVGGEIDPDFGWGCHRRRVGEARPDDQGEAEG
jgi:hypothetical protein